MRRPTYRRIFRRSALPVTSDHAGRSAIKETAADHVTVRFGPRSTGMKARWRVVTHVSALVLAAMVAFVAAYAKGAFSPWLPQETKVGMHSPARR